MSSPRFRAAICGGGVGGLTFAVALSQYSDIIIDVYEAAQSFQEVGAGVGVFPRAFKVLRKLGADIEQRLLEYSSSGWTEEFVPVIKSRKSDQPVGTEVCQLMSKGHLMRFHRAHFHGVLLSRIPSTCTIHTSKRLQTYSQPIENSTTSPITLTFTDGSTAVCDILIGADGIKSAVRRNMLHELAESMEPGKKEIVLSCINPVWSGITAYRTLVSAEKLRERYPDHRALREHTQYMGKDAYFLAYPIGLGKYVNVAGFAMQRDLVATAYETEPGTPRPSFGGRSKNEWVSELTAEQFVEPFKDFEEDAQAVLQFVEKGTVWAVHTVQTLPTTHFGRVAILGDAAHAMMPFQGSGAGQSIEDAYLLATVLGHEATTLETVPRALAIYDKLRRPFSSDVALRSRLTGQQCAFQVDVPLHELEDAMTKNWEWAWMTELDDDLNEAVRLVEEGSSNINVDIV